jgi:hypothetical protein
LKHRFLKWCVVNSEAESSESSDIKVIWEGDSGDNSLLYQATDMVEAKTRIKVIATCLVTMIRKLFLTLQVIMRRRRNVKM